MSFNALKNTLKPCPSYSTSSFSQLPETSNPIPNPISRKPPKSSLTQQLQRLQEPPLPQTLDTHFPSHPQEPEDVSLSLRREPIAVTQFDSTGPFEPLILSSPSEIPVVQVPASINCRLLEHQREGVRFLYSLYKNNHGGVLGDDMGLGKTIQTIAFLAAVLRKDAEHGEPKIQTTDLVGKKDRVLIVCPTSVIQNWENEFSDWGTFCVAVYHGPNRDLILEKLEAGGMEILITSFDTFRIHDKILSEVQWDIVIVDEAHRLKNEKSQLYKACLGIKTSKRFGLTGTVIQNKILELFNLFDWVAPGSLGTREHFRDFYDEPLKHGQRLSAPKRFVQIADERKKHLVEVLHKYLLRRTKEETIGHLMMGKEDNVVFCAMSELQKRVYKRMLELPDIQCLVNKDQPCSCGSPLTQVECCKRIVPNGIIWSYLHKDNPEGCDSCPFCLVLPCIIKLQQISNHLELIKPNPRDDPEKQRKDAELASAVFGTDIDLVGGIAQSESFMSLSDVEHCGKMRALGKLMSSWVSQGDKILLFSYSVRMLDILEKFLIRKGYCFSRLDGSTPMSARQSLVDDFNSSPSKQVFLISTRAGGLGLNLVSANRVVIFDPNWNPAQDLQAQDRSFRYGQKRHVVVFRLLSAGSLEELVYSRQVYKQQLSNIAISGKMEKRYFEGVQDCKEFQGELFGICNLFRDLSDKLFTSEIVELHKKHELESANFHADALTNETTSDISLQFVGRHPFPKHGDEASLLGAEVGKSNIQDIATKSRRDKPVLADLLNNSGIMYAHRNEDIVNAGPSDYDSLPASRGKAGGIISLPWSTRDPEPTTSAKQQQSNYDFDKKPAKKKAVDRHDPEEASKREEGEGKKKQKKSQKKYGELAEFKGMGELEFSKWLLSASSLERKQLLEDYSSYMKQQKEKHEED